MQQNALHKLFTIGWDGLDWIDLAQDMGNLQGVVKAAKNFRVP